MRAITVGLLLAVIATADGVAEERTELSEVRRVYKAVRVALERRTLTKRERRFEYREPYQDASRSMYVSAGLVRLYVREAGSDDSAVTWNQYYDERGRLRFVLITAGAVNGTRVEHRIWFASDGRRIREQQKLLEGPGYTFPDPWPEEDLVREPQQAFGSPNPCKEVSGD